MSWANTTPENAIDRSMIRSTGALYLDEAILYWSREIGAWHICSTDTMALGNAKLLINQRAIFSLTSICMYTPYYLPNLGILSTTITCVAEGFRLVYLRADVRISSPSIRLRYELLSYWPCKTILSLIKSTISSYLLGFSCCFRSSGPAAQHACHLMPKPALQAYSTFATDNDVEIGK